MLKGSQNLRQQLLLSDPTSIPTLIEDIHVDTTCPGLLRHEFSLLRLVETISDDCHVVMSKSMNLVELFKNPHVEGLKRKLSSKLSADEDCYLTQWEVGECIGTWCKSDFETLPGLYLPESGKNPKELSQVD
ncbi:hypothetical protein LXL04_039596 [Taraxacum kok-saghyz]